MIIYVDGSCVGNGKKNAVGGFGVIVLDNNKNIIRAYSERSENTTNNREELKAILWAMKNYGAIGANVFSDSSYCIQTFTDWMYTWKRQGWTKSDKQTPENLDLIQEYYNLEQQGYSINLLKVKGHSGIDGNEIVDKLAKGLIAPEEVMNNGKK